MRFAGTVFLTWLCLTIGLSTQAAIPSTIRIAPETEKEFKDQSKDFRAYVDKALHGDDSDVVALVRVSHLVGMQMYGYTHASHGLSVAFSDVARQLGDEKISRVAAQLTREEKDSAWGFFCDGLGADDAGIHRQFPKTLQIFEDAFPPEGLQSPKELVAPTVLTRASYYMDGGSLGGTLRDSRDQQLHFFFDRGLDLSNYGTIYIGFASGHGRERMKARFDGWQKEDLYTVIEQAIQEQFFWNATSQKLRPKKPQDSASQAFSDDVPFSLLAVKRILHYVEKGLGRKTTFMK